jgi:hypothetical protein
MQTLQNYTFIENKYEMRDIFMCMHYYTRLQDQPHQCREPINATRFITLHL